MTARASVMQTYLPRCAPLVRHLAVAIALLYASPAFAGAEPATKVPAQPATSQIAEGEAIARARCAVCHAVGVDDESPTWANANTAFRALSERFPIAMLQQAASSGLVSGHDEMPGFQFSMDEITALLAYIDSLAPHDKRYLTSPVQH